MNNVKSDGDRISNQNQKNGAQSIVPGTDVGELKEMVDIIRKRPNKMNVDTEPDKYEIPSSLQRLRGSVDNMVENIDEEVDIFIRNKDKQDQKKVMKYISACLNTNGGIVKLNNRHFQKATGKDLSVWYGDVEKQLFSDSTKFIEFEGMYNTEILYLRIKPFHYIFSINTYLYFPRYTDIVEARYAQAIDILLISDKPGSLFELPAVQGDFYCEKTHLTLSENYQTQFKEIRGINIPGIFSSMINRCISAFSNHKGGRIFFGIENKTFKVVGVELTEKDKQSITNLMYDKMENTMKWGCDNRTYVYGKHWSIDFLPVKNINKPITPGKTLEVIMVSVCRYPGGVFTATPTAYYIREEDRTIQQFTFQEWMIKMVGTYKDFFRNPAGNIPEDILRMDDDSIQIYMNALKSGFEIKKDIRVIVVGKKGAGKTCLVRKLLKQNLDNVDSTNGIDIHVKRCKIRTTDGKWIFQEGNLDSDINHRIMKSLITHTRADDPSMSVAEIKQEQHESGKEERYENLEAIELAETPNQTKDTHSVILENTQIITTVPANAVQEMSVGLTDNPYYSDLKEIIHSAKDIDSEEYATVCFWDFAGDKEFYNTHQIFLSKEAIYLVVTKLNETDDETNETFKFWFDSVHFYGATHDTHEDNSSQTDESDSMSSFMGTTALENFLEPPIIAVGTHKDQSTDNFQKALADTIKNYLGDSAARQHLRECHYVSNSTDKDHIFEALRTGIYEISKNRSNFGKVLPVRFIKLEKSINEKLQSGKQFLSFDDIKAIAEANETVTDDAELDVFLRYQHGFGNMIYYKDIPEYIILNPQWLVNAFRVLVTAEKYQPKLIGHKEWDTYENYGKLCDNLLNCIFESQTKDIKECKEHILKIMEKFDIIVRPKMLINGKEHVESHFYVPCMIKTITSKDIQKQLKTPHQKSFCLCLVFNFLPPVFINQLIISCIRKFPMSKVGGQTKHARPALFRHTALFDINPCEKVFVASFQNVIQIQIWKYDSGNRSSYIDIRNFIQAEVDKIIQERYGMIHIKYEVSLKCDRTSYDIVEGTKNLVNMKDDEDFYCEEHDEMHVYKDDWFNEEQKTKKAVQCQTDQENLDCKKEKDIPGFEIIVSTKVHTASTASLDHNLEETSSTSVLPINNKKQVLKESFTADELNFAKLGKIALNVLRDALYDLLKLDKDGDTSYTMPDKSDSDITSLYKEHRVLNTHVPSKSSTRPKLWGGKWTDISITDTGIGDDIERIRLTRNELQHAKSFSIDDVRYKELCVILQDVLNRFDQINKPSPLYTKRMNDVLLMELNRDDLKNIKHELEHSLKRKTDYKVETDCNTHVETKCQIKIPKLT